VPGKDKKGIRNKTHLTKNNAPLGSRKKSGASYVDAVSSVKPERKTANFASVRFGPSAPGTSALTPTSDMLGAGINVSKVPAGDICGCNFTVGLFSSGTLHCYGPAAH
jgi:hypothetical protein